MTVIECAPIIISVLALGFSLYTHFKYDDKIKKQNALINKFTLDKLEKEKEQEKLAIIEANVDNGEKSSRVIKVYNKGKAIAKNVVVSFPDKPNIAIINNPSPINILPHHSINIRINVFIGSPSSTKIAFEWEDGVRMDNKGSQVIQL